MAEFPLISDIPPKKFHSALLTTFSLDFYFLESRVVSICRSKGIRNIAVLADARMVDESINIASTHIKKSTSLYTLNTILQNGAFHPKVHVFLGDEAILVNIGSGNISSGGFGRNHELFTSLYADKDDLTQLPLIGQVWKYLKSLCEPFKGITAYQLSGMEQYCTLLENIPESNEVIKLNGLELRFLTSREKAIWPAIQEQIPSPISVEKITVLSPYFDNGGRLIQKMSEHFSRADMDVIIQPDYALLPYDMKENPRISFFNWQETKAYSEKSDDYPSFVHAKLFHIKAGDTEYLITGSANATDRAFLHGATANEEAVLLLKGQNVGWLNSIGIEGHKNKIDVAAFKPQTTLSPVDTVATVTYRYKIHSADMQAEALRLFLSKAIEAATALKIYSADKVELWTVNIERTEDSSVYIDIPSAEIVNNALYVALFDDSMMQISNKQLVNNESAIAYNNPSPENRKLQRLLEKIDSGTYAEIEIYEHYDLIFSDWERSQLKKKNSKRRSNNTHQTNEEDDVQEHAGNTAGGKALSILNSYMSRIATERKQEDEDNIDDEENGDIKTGNNREKKQKKAGATAKTPQKKTIERRRKKFSEYYTKYVGALSSRSAEEHKITTEDLAAFVLSMLNMFKLEAQEVEYTEQEGEGKEKLISEAAFPFKGPLHEQTSFEGVAVNVIGKFLGYMASASGFMEYKFQYDRTQHDHMRLLAQGLILLALSKMYNNNTFHKKKDKWFMLLLVNAIFAFKRERIDVFKEIKRQLDMFGVTDIDWTDGVDCIAALYEKYYDEIGSLGTGISKLDNYSIILLDEIGYCCIEKFIPDITTPKSLKITNLMFSFEGEDFTHDQLYNLQLRKLLPSVDVIQRD